MSIQTAVLCASSKAEHNRVAACVAMQGSSIWLVGSCALLLGPQTTHCCVLTLLRPEWCYGFDGGLFNLTSATWGYPHTGVKRWKSEERAREKKKENRGMKATKVLSGCDWPTFSFHQWSASGLSRVRSGAAVYTFISCDWKVADYPRAHMKDFLCKKAGWQPRVRVSLTATCLSTSACMLTEEDLAQVNTESLEVRGFTFPKQDASQTQTRCHAPLK